MALALFAAATACTSKDPHAVAAAADASAHVGIYAWLADHDPSGVLVVGLDPNAVRAAAPSARVLTGTSAGRDCARALRERTLLAEIVRVRTPERDRAEDCGYALYRDSGSIVVAPR